MTRVAFLWHMHQPYYEDLVTREHILPWVRLHALKDYYGMVALLEEFPAVRMTFNLVPSLLVQLEAFAEGRAHDRALELSLKPADSLTPEDVTFVLGQFFHAQRTRMIDIYPRYAELLAQRGEGVSGSDLQAAARRFTVDDLRDLQVWHKLAWIDPYYMERDGRIQALLGKGRGFNEEDKAILRKVELEILNAVIPAYRARADAGQIEIATSPFYHPILPLLCDTEIYKRTHPQSSMPRRRFQHPEDAQEQLTRAVACHERLFGRRPVGLWPSEGSVSDAMVPLVAAAGFEWMATDELILARSLGTTFGRDAAGLVDQPERLYRPYRVEAGGAQVACGFRDHMLSDLIGFVYAGWSADAAADDFVAKLADAGRRGSAGGEDATVFIILDGENAWEHFPTGGRPFLRALYQRLSDHPELQTVTMAEACRPASQSLQGIFPGSWIDANFYIWIGHPDDHRGWSQLADARDVIDRTPAQVDPTVRARAKEELFIAEGSDWFWWYGDDHSSDHDLEFDDLFRRHLRNVYRLLGQPVPDELFTTNISAGADGPTHVDPIRLVTPTIDGEDSSYFEWLGAGTLDTREVAGAMHQTTREALMVGQVRFGFDRRCLYVRMDGIESSLRDRADRGYAFSLVFLQPAGIRITLGREGCAFYRRPAPTDAWRRTESTATGAIGRIAELAVPLQELQADAGTLSLFIAVHDRHGVEMERHPAIRLLELTIPTDSFEATHWSA